MNFFTVADIHSQFRSLINDYKEQIEMHKTSIEKLENDIKYYTDQKKEHERQVFLWEQHVEYYEKMLEKSGTQQKITYRDKSLDEKYAFISGNKFLCDEDENIICFPTKKGAEQYLELLNEKADKKYRIKNIGR